ncbi:hypothetical protein HIM_03721 [Hirsutella minnesotensis 3608]|uniref:Complex III subunit 7 n=1 Tax=Hirsutella minnesotensis 3608 TaxID=1043627 RepID=A0A0F8A6C6_9HYPO|nr:hypothetical protein HIM_03721 [Hirsutella minnesotensis 3608]
MSAPSLAPFVLRRPWLTKMLMPLAGWYSNAAGYRKLGLRYDDLLEEEREAVQIALKRLSPKEAYERVYRIRRSTQCSYQHKLLPRDQWTKPEEVFQPFAHAAFTRHPSRRMLHELNADPLQDTPYLRRIIDQVETELAEKDALDSMHVYKKH